MARMGVVGKYDVGAAAARARAGGIGEDVARSEEEEEEDDDDCPSAEVVLGPYMKKGYKGKCCKGIMAKGKLKMPLPGYMEQTCKRRRRSRRRKDNKKSGDESEDSDADNGAASRKKRKNEKNAVAVHPSIVFIREHTPVKPCGRCKQCRAMPCGRCVNCVSNARAAEQKRCMELGCSSLTKEELRNFHIANSSTASITQLRSELSALRDEYIALSAGKSNGADMEELERRQDEVIQKLQDFELSKGLVATKRTPDGYKFLLLSFQTIEDERKRIAKSLYRSRNVEPSATTRSRRQLCTLYARTICNMVQMFATDIVAAEYVEQLLKVTSDYEKSLPVGPVEK